MTLSLRELRNAMFAYMEGVIDKNANRLKWNTRNRKLDDIPGFSIPAGHSCPFARECRTCAIPNPNCGKDTGRMLHGQLVQRDNRKFILQNGPDTEWRCYTAIDEVMKPTVRRARWHNFILLHQAIRQGIQATTDLIEKSLPTFKFWRNPPHRVHVAGDFFDLVYFDAWMEVARRHPDKIFYAYTKALPFWVSRMDTIPSNFKLTASYGGTHDWMIEAYGLRSVKVVATPEEAHTLGLELDHDDSHAYGDGGNFALLIHGQQPAGTRWAKAWVYLKKRGLGGYGKQKDNLISALRKS